MSQAIARDPNYGPALSYAAIDHFRAVTDFWSKDPEADTRQAIDFARRALAFARDDPGAIIHAATVLAYLGEDIGSMIALVDRALTLNPSFARGWYISGGLRIWAGDLAVGIERVEAARSVLKPPIPEPGIGLEAQLSRPKPPHLFSSEQHLTKRFSNAASHL